MMKLKFLFSAALWAVFLCPVFAQTLPNHAVPISRGPGITGYHALGPCSADVPLVGQGTTSDPDCSDNGAWTGFANPSVSVGLTAKNGTATTSLRSDAAPALDQSISPTWTGTHTFNILPVLPNQSANTVFAGPSSGASATPAFRALVGGDLPFPSASTLGGIESKTCSTHQWINVISTSGVPSCTQPAFSDISGTVAASQLPNPTALTLGGVKSLSSVSHQFLTSIGTDGTPTQAQPSFADISGTATGAQLPNPSATTLGGVKSLAAVSHNFLTSITTAGLPVAAQPACADISDAGTSCTANTGTSGATIPFLNGTNTWSGTQNFTGTFQAGGNTQTFPSAAATLAALNIEDQTLSGGANVTAKSLTTGSITVDCGARPIQTIINGGAFTITAPSNDGYCLVKTTNNATAGSITFSGFSVGANTGDTLDTTNGHKFIISIIRAGGDSTYSVKALQ